MKDILVADRYRLDRKLGQGGFGLVYSGTDLQSDEKVAIKVESIENGPDELRDEEKAYEAPSGGVGIENSPPTSTTPGPSVSTTGPTTHIFTGFSVTDLKRRASTSTMSMTGRRNFKKRLKDIQGKVDS